MTDDNPIGRLEHAAEIRRFVLAGNATFTLVCGNDRVTFKVKSNKIDKFKNWSTNNVDRTVYFVSVLFGPSNESDYLYMGLLKLDALNGQYDFGITKNSRFNESTLAYQLFYRLWIGVEQGCKRPSTLEFWHEGQCCVCGRKLTVPESIAAGIGPECAEKGM